MTKLEKFINKAIDERLKKGGIVNDNFIKLAVNNFYKLEMRNCRAQSKIIDAQIATFRKNKHRNITISTSNFGGKTEPYFDEEEMENGYIPPEFHELSVPEQEIWYHVKFKFEKQ